MSFWLSAIIVVWVSNTVYPVLFPYCALHCFQDVTDQTCCNLAQTEQEGVQKRCQNETRMVSRCDNVCSKRVPCVEGAGTIRSVEGYRQLKLSPVPHPHEASRFMYISKGHNEAP